MYRNAGILRTLVYGIRDGDSDKMESKKDLLPHELIFLIHQELCRNMTENDDLDLTVQCIAMASWNWFLQNRE